VVSIIFYDFPEILGIILNTPNWRTHIFQRGRYTTNQSLCIGDLGLLPKSLVHSHIHSQWVCLLLRWNLGGVLKSGYPKTMGSLVKNHDRMNLREPLGSFKYPHDSWLYIPPRFRTLWWFDIAENGPFSSMINTYSKVVDLLRIISLMMSPSYPKNVWRIASSIWLTLRSRRSSGAGSVTGGTGLGNG